MADNENGTKPAEGPETAPGALLSYAQVRRRLGVPPGTLYALVHSGSIPHIRIGKRLVRFRPEDIERWLAEHTVIPSEVK